MIGIPGLILIALGLLSLAVILVARFRARRRNFVVTPDPLLDTRFAASAWGFALRSTCFDLEQLGHFIDDHYGHAPEDLCSDGIDPLDAANGFPSPCPTQ